MHRNTQLTGLGSLFLGCASSVTQIKENTEIFDPVGFPGLYDKQVLVFQVAQFGIWLHKSYVDCPDKCKHY